MPRDVARRNVVMRRDVMSPDAQVTGRVDQIKSNQIKSINRLIASTRKSKTRGGAKRDGRAGQGRAGQSKERRDGRGRGEEQGKSRQTDYVRHGRRGMGGPGLLLRHRNGPEKKETADSVVDSVVGRQKECHDDVT